MPKLIIGLVGQAGCGKGTVADLLVKEYGAAYFRFSSILSDIAARLSLEKTRDNLIKLSNSLRGSFGEDILSYAIEKDALSSDKDLVVIDGIRRPEDIVALEPLPLFKLVAIDVDPKLRFERMKKRGEKVGESDMSWEQFQTEDRAPTEITIPMVMARATVTIKNNETREELKSAIHQLMKEAGF
jgi:dephospho-CoA kinase